MMNQTTIILQPDVSTSDVGGLNLIELTLLPSSVVGLLITCALFLTSCKLWDTYYALSRDPSFNLPLPPGNMGFPFVGETLHFVLGGIEFFRRRQKSHGNIFKTHMLGRPTIRVIGGENVRRILLGEHSLVTTSWPTSTQKILGSGALSLSLGTIHKMRRKVVCKAFNRDALNQYIRPMQQIIRQYIKKWCSSGFVLGYQECRVMAFSIAGKVLVGFQMDERETLETLEVFQEMIANLFSLPISFPGSGLYKGMRARRKLLEKIQACIERKEKQPLDSDITDALSFIILAHTEGDEQLSRQDVLEAALELLFAGHETTASASCSIIMQLGQHPGVTQKLMEELFDAGLLSSDDDANVDADVINQLSYLNNVIKEVLRVIPPIGGAFRKALKTFEIQGFQIPKGWTITYSIRDTHHTAEMFEDGERFDPERWDKLSVKQQGPSERFSYVPFGGGSRACVGKEFAKLMLKIFTIELCRSCSWRLLNGKPTINYLPVPHPSDDMPVEFEENHTFRRRTCTI